MRKLRQLPTVRRLKELFKYEDGILYHKTDATSSLGLFKTIEEAIEAYKQAAKRYYGE